MAALAALVPLVVYALTAGAHSYWLDSAEFTAAAIKLDIPHPPGHPLFGLWSKPFTLLPIGPLPYRVAIAEAVAAALALGSVHTAVTRTLDKLGCAPHVPRSLLALAATWTLAGAYGFWFQAIRAEVYALEAMLVCASLERLTALDLDAPRPDPRPLYQACLALGLGLANHHFIAVLGLPALAYALVVLLRAHGPRVFGGGLTSGLLGLACYVYLPLRAASLPPMDLGHPVSLRDFVWVVSAQVYARNIGTQALQPLGERFADLLVILIENFTPFALPLALLGAYALVRTRATWPLAYVWIITVSISLCGRAFLNPVRANPDVLGYMMPGFAALLVLAAAGVAAPFVASTESAARVVFAALATLLAALGLGQFVHGSEQSSLRHFHASDDFDDTRRRALPTRALVVLTTPDVTFRHWEGEAVEALRADVTMLPLPFLGYGGSNQVLLRRHPELTSLVDQYMARGQLSYAALRALAVTRPVLVELDAAAALPLFPFVVPDGLLYRVLSAPPSADEVTSAAHRRERTQAALLARVHDDLHEPETQKNLLWSRYVEALYYSAHGALPEARASVRAGLSLAPRTRELLLLERALSVARGPIAIAPFLVHAER
ncbi:MAG: hypothetical protein RLZZ450_7593, partial [Pseudomonadota bacterium]